MARYMDGCDRNEQAHRDGHGVEGNALGLSFAVIAWAS